MCVLKSAIILKDRVFLPDYDSHDRMLDELGIADTAKNAARLFVRAELVPKDGDIFSDVSAWQYRVDQDILPEWYAEEYDKSRMLEAVKRWADEHVHVDKTIDKITDGLHYIKNSTVSACNNSKVIAYGNSTVSDCDNSMVIAYGNSTVYAYDNSTVSAYDNSTVSAYGNSTVSAYDNSTVSAYDNSTVSAYDNSTVSACENSTVIACGNSTVSAYDNSTVSISKYSLCSHKNVSLYDFALLKDYKTGTIYYGREWKVKKK